MSAKGKEVIEAKMSLAIWANKNFEKGLIAIDAPPPVISLGKLASSTFVAARSPDEPYVFFGVHNTLMPWFMNIGWEKIVVIPRMRRISIVAKASKVRDLTIVIHAGDNLCKWLASLDVSNVRIPLRSFLFVDTPGSKHSNVQEGKSLAWSDKIYRKLPIEIKG